MQARPGFGPRAFCPPILRSLFHLPIRGPRRQRGAGNGLLAMQRAGARSCPVRGRPRLPRRRTAAFFQRDALQRFQSLRRFPLRPCRLATFRSDCAQRPACSGHGRAPGHSWANGQRFKRQCAWGGAVEGRSIPEQRPAGIGDADEAGGHVGEEAVQLRMVGAEVVQFPPRAGLPRQGGRGVPPALAARGGRSMSASGGPWARRRARLGGGAMMPSQAPARLSTRQQLALRARPRRTARSASAWARQRVLWKWFSRAGVGRSPYGRGKARFSVQDRKPSDRRC